MRRSPTKPGQSSHPTLISGPTSDLVCTCSKISPRRDLKAGAASQLYPRSTSAKNPHYSRQLSLTFDLSCMGPKSSPIPSDEYHSQDLVHAIGEKPSQLTVTVLVGRTLRKKGLMRWLVRSSAVACAAWLSPVRSVTKRED